MANPNPQHNPTDGKGVAAFVQITGTNVSNCANGGLTVAQEGTPNDTTGLNGQGYGAVSSANHPVAQYQVQLSRSGKTIGGTVYASTVQLTTVLKDVANTTYTPVGTPVYRSYGDPANKAATPPAWYKPSRGTSGGITGNTSYDENVASVSSSGLVTARANGQTIIEVAFPTFDNTLGTDAQVANGITAEPKNFIYAQLITNVVS